MNAVPIAKSCDQCARCRAAADDEPLQRRERIRSARHLRLIHFVKQAEEDGWHTGAHGHAFVRDESCDVFRIGEDTHVHLLRARHRARVRISPRVDVKHRHDRHDAIATVHAEQVCAEAGKTVQCDCAVAVENTFRITRSPARIAHAARLTLVDFRIRERRRLTADERFVVDHAVRQSAGHWSKHNNRRHARRVLAKQRDHAGENVLDEQNSVFSVIQDVGDLLERQSDVHHVADCADRRCTEVQFVMSIGVERHRRHAIACLHARGHQRVAQLQNARIRLAVCGPVHARNRRFGDGVCSDRHHRYHLAVGKQAHRPLENRRDGERIVHHRGFEHSCSGAGGVRTRLLALNRSAGGKTQQEYERRACSDDPTSGLDARVSWRRRTSPPR